MEEKNDLAQKIQKVVSGSEDKASEESRPLKIPDFNKPAEIIQAPNINQHPVISKTLIRTDYVMRGVIFSALSILLLIAVYLTFNYAQNFLTDAQKSEEKNLVFENDLVRADRSRVISLEAGASKELVQSVIIQALKNERIETGNISLVMPAYLRETIVSGKKQLISEPQRGDDFFFTFAQRSPINLRAISSDKYAVGVAGVGNDPNNFGKDFFVFSVSSPPDAVRELHNWENQMYYDMKDVLNLREINGDLVFRDLSSNNHLLRVASDDNGVMLVYGFGAPKTVIIAPDAETFEIVYQHLK